MMKLDLGSFDEQSSSNQGFKKIRRRTQQIYKTKLTSYFYYYLKSYTSVSVFTECKSLKHRKIKIWNFFMELFEF